METNNKNYFQKLLSLTLILMLSLSGAMSKALEPTTSVENTVLTDIIISVYFASPDHQGQYHFQILKNGNAQSVDNKGKVTVWTKLSKETLVKLNKNISTVPDDVKIIPSKEPKCMDAPGFSTFVYKQNQKQVQIYSKIGCVDNFTDNDKVNDFAKWLMDMKKLFEQQPVVSEATLAQLQMSRFGQEGYGDVYPVPPLEKPKKRIYSCKEVTPNNQANLLVEIYVKNDLTQYWLKEITRIGDEDSIIKIIEVFKNVSRRPGAPVVYADHSNQHKLSIQKNAAPEPGKVFLAQYQVTSESQTEIHSMKCTAQ